MKCKLFEAQGTTSTVADTYAKPTATPSNKSGVDDVSHKTKKWYEYHAADIARIDEGVILHTGKMKRRFDYLDAINAKAKKWHEYWDAQLTNHSLTFAGV